jgi:N-methylhydantoinase A
MMTDSADFDFTRVEAALTEIDGELDRTAAALRERGLAIAAVEHFVEARYAHQVWELEIPMRSHRLESMGEVEVLVTDFHATHERIFAVTDPDQDVEAVYWKGRLTAQPRKPGLAGPPPPPSREPRRRIAHFPEVGAVEVDVHDGGSLAPGTVVDGPLLIAEPTTTIVVPPGATLRITELGDYLVEGLL